MGVVDNNAPGENAPPSAWEARIHQLRLQWYVLSRNRVNLAAVIFIGLLIIVAIFAPWVAPHPESISGTVNLKAVLQPPSWSYPMGTDEFGRDIFSRVLYGTRLSVGAAAATVALATIIGTVIGAVAVGIGGVVDDILMRIVDIFLAFPVVVLAIVIAAYWGGSLRNAIFAIAISAWPYYSRIMRSTAVSVRERPFVRAAVANGTPRRTIIFRHILPSSIGPCLVNASIDFGFVILSLAALSFLGVGAQPPVPEWGLMINQSRAYFLQAWWYMAFPGMAITLSVLAFNLLGDGLEEVLNPKMRGRGG